jgi:hypothetical protein
MPVAQTDGHGVCGEEAKEAGRDGGGFGQVSGEFIANAE